MGISDFYDVIKMVCADVLVKAPLEMLRGQKVAIDISIFLNQFVKTSGPERWVDRFILLFCCLKKCGIKPVSIFDGPNPPVEKKKEQERRRKESAKIQTRIEEGKRLLKTMKKTAEAGGDLDETTIENVKNVIGVRRGKNVDAINYDDIYDVISSLTTHIDRKEIQNLPILPIYAQKAKEIIEMMGFAWFQAEGEAETLCASMCCLGMVDAVMSEDTDVLAYGTPFLISKFDMKEETVTIVSHEAILEGMEMNHEEFLDLCILLSCDYNERVKGFPPDGRKYKKPAAIGAKKALCMIQEYRRLEKVEEYLEDSHPLNYRRCRELFTPHENLPNISIPYSRPIDKKKTINFLRENNCKIKLDYILKTWEPVDIMFGNQNSEEEILTDEEEAPTNIGKLIEDDEGEENPFLLIGGLPEDEE
jgi:5'-3' exonuclease